jgi:WD40 repeat protein
MVFSPDSKRFVAGSGSAGDKKDPTKGGQLKLWDVETGTVIRVWNAHYHLVWAADFSLDGKLLVSSSNEREVRVWDPETGRQLATLDSSGSQCLSVAFSPDGRNLVAAGSDGLTVWDVEMPK